VLEPFGRGARRMRLQRQIPDDRALSDTLRSEHSALLFLRRPPSMSGRARGIFGKRRKGDDMAVDLIRTLVALQRKTSKPIVLVPQTFVWTKRPVTNHGRSAIDLFFGPAEWPGRVRVVLQFLFNYKNSLLRSGEPF